MNKITIDPITRLEGHGKIEIFLHVKTTSVLRALPLRVSAMKKRESIGCIGKESMRILICCQMLLLISVIEKIR